MHRHRTHWPVWFSNRTPCVLATAMLILVNLTATGCLSINTNTLRRAAYVAQLGSGSALKVRKTPRNPLEDQLNLFARKGPNPSPRTSQVLRRYGLEESFEKNPEQAFEQLREAVRQEPQLETTYAVAEVAYVLGVKYSSSKKQDQALRLYGESLATSYEYLFDDRFSTDRNPYDPEFRGACDLYNASLEGMLRIMAEEGFLNPGYTGSVELMGRRLDVAFNVSGRWDPSDIQEFRFTSDYEVKGLNNSYRSYGLGVPLIAIRSSNATASEPDEQYYPKGLTFPVTAFFRLLPSRLPNGNDSQNLLCTIELHDPLENTEVQVAGTTTPLESDISTPLAYYLNDPLVGTNTLATFALLDANFGKDFEGLYMLEPYDPDKIPVVMVHGLWSSPITWMEMFNDLHAMKDIRQDYQFWFYMYPTGQPFWISAEQMREDLADVRRKLDPQDESKTLDQMVLVGHSMGGLVSRLQTIDSGDRFWSLVSNRPFEELNADEETRTDLRQVLYFTPDTSVKRIVTIGTPHQGSQFANSTTRWLGRQLLTLPSLLTQKKAAVVRDNPEFFNDTELLTINTSIDSLSPESPFLEAMLDAQSAPWVKHHNIVGLVEDKNFNLWIGTKVTGEGDGVVPFESAHFDRAVSEVVVPEEHQKIHQHPIAILEIRRILKEHAEEARSTIRRDPAVQHVEFQGERTTANPEQQPVTVPSITSPRVARAPVADATGAGSTGAESTAPAASTTTPPAEDSPDTQPESAPESKSAVEYPATTTPQAPDFLRSRLSDRPAAPKPTPPPSAPPAAVESPQPNPPAAPAETQPAAKRFSLSDESPSTTEPETPPPTESDTEPKPAPEGEADAESSG